MNRLKILLPNLTCAGCVPKVEQVMRQQEGVIWAVVNFAAGEATIICDSAAFKMSQLVLAVSRLGFQIVPSDDTNQRARTGFVEPKSLARMQQWVRALSR